MLSVTPQLEIKYRDRCFKCLQYHFKKYGCYASSCAFKYFDNCYCPQIEKLEHDNKGVCWF